MISFRLSHASSVGRTKTRGREASGGTVDASEIQPVALQNVLGKELVLVVHLHPTKDAT